MPNGFVSFGHIHGRNTYGKKIFYSGSFTRWGFNEISPEASHILLMILIMKNMKSII